jgi:hypothetical protein
VLKKEVNKDIMVSAYYIQKRLNFDDSDWSLHHSYMFHGMARRRDAEYPVMHYCIDNQLQHPLHLIRNTYAIPDIFQPNTNWIVAENIRDLIPKSNSVRFLKVEYEKLFFEEYDKESLFSISSEEELFDLYSHDESLSGRHSNYYELITYRLQDIKDEYENSKNILIESDISEFEVNISMDMFNKYPIVWKKGVFVRQDIFDKISKYLSKDFFTCIPIK